MIITFPCLSIAIVGSFVTLPFQPPLVALKTVSSICAHARAPTCAHARTHARTGGPASTHAYACARLRVLAGVRVDPPCVRACARMCPRVGRSNPPWRTRHFLLCRCRIRGFPKDTSGNQTERARQVKGNPARKRLGASERGCFLFLQVCCRACACARVRTCACVRARMWARMHARACAR